jgi:putative transposase
LDLERVTTLDEFNLRLWTWVEMEYHRQTHSSLSGRTPLDVWESEAEQIRWVDDPNQLEQNFYAQVERLARNDSTVQWRGVFYEVPPYLRRQRVRLRYALLDPTHVSVLDGETEIPLRPVQPVENANRSRVGVTRGAEPTPKTGLNAAELILARAAGKDPQGGGDE